MTYEQALAFLHRHVNYERQSPHPAQLTLDGMRALLARLGNPHRRLRIVHVAGSKGKGSTSAMLEAALRASGYRTGLFTSPHLEKFAERIQVNGRPISEEAFVSLVEDIQSQTMGLGAGATTAIGPRATFFELTTAIGLLHFVRRRVEIAIVEVGLGGRFDSTNVCQPLISVITSISLDHTQQLGSRLASIAAEKAGILKRGVPAISGALDPEARQVIEAIARDREVPLIQLGKEVGFDYEPGKVTADGTTPSRVLIRTGERTWPAMELSLLGQHQAANAGIAVATLEQLRRAGLHVPDAAIRQGLARVTWPARLEVVSRRPLVVLDCAHNRASAEALAQALTQSFPDHASPHSCRRLLVFAVSGDKDIAGILGALAPQFTHAFLTRYAGSTRAAAPEDLADVLLRCSSIPHTKHQTAPEALRAALAVAGPQDLVCITGSVFLAGELRPVLVKVD